MQLCFALTQKRESRGLLPSSLQWPILSIYYLSSGQGAAECWWWSGQRYRIWCRLWRGQVRGSVVGCSCGLSSSHSSNKRMVFRYSVRQSTGTLKTWVVRRELSRRERNCPPQGTDKKEKNQTLLRVPLTYLPLALANRWSGNWWI